MDDAIMAYQRSLARPRSAGALTSGWPTSAAGAPQAIAAYEGEPPGPTGRCRARTAPACPAAATEPPAP